MNFFKFHGKDVGIDLGTSCILVVLNDKGIIKNEPAIKAIEKKIVSNCEANCFSNGKKGNITPSLAIMNLKSNHGWTDRNDITTGGNEINIPPIQWVNDEGK